MKPWTDIRQWIAEEDRCIEQGFDSITAYTGEEGTGKSYGMLVRQNLADPTFFSPEWSDGWQPTSPRDRVVFEEDHCKRLGLQLPTGSAVQLDESDAHRRAAMTKGRRAWLKFLKERRSLQLRLAVGYPHVSQIDRDILRSRVRYRAHQPHRGLLEVKSRVVVREETDRLGNPVPIIRWELRGRFNIPDLLCGYCHEHQARDKALRKAGIVVDKPWSPLTRSEKCRCPAIIRIYDRKKYAFTHRDDDLSPLAVPDVQPRLIDREAALPVVEKLRSNLGLPPNQVFYDQVLADLKSAP